MLGAPRTVRNVSLVEGVSLLVLLFVAMPLKYRLGYEVAVRIAGSLHGALFVALVVVCAVSLISRRLPLRILIAVGLLSVVPLGFVVADRWIRAVEGPKTPS